MSKRWSSSGRSGGKKKSLRRTAAGKTNFRLSDARDVLGIGNGGGVFDKPEDFKDDSFLVRVEPKCCVYAFVAPSPSPPASSGRPRLPFEEFSNAGRRARINEIGEAHNLSPAMVKALRQSLLASGSLEDAGNCDSDARLKRAGDFYRAQHNREAARTVLIVVKNLFSEVTDFKLAI